MCVCVCVVWCVYVVYVCVCDLWKPCIRVGWESVNIFCRQQIILMTSRGMNEQIHFTFPLLWRWHWLWLVCFSQAGNSAVHDTVVNQLLAKLDGVEQLNNILVIGQYWQLASLRLCIYAHLLLYHLLYVLFNDDDDCQSVECSRHPLKRNSPGM